MYHIGFPSTKGYDGDSDILLCPECGDVDTHLDSVRPYYEDDGRLCIKLNFYCECGHKFSIDFEQHEGITYLETSLIKGEFNDYHTYINSDEWREKRNEVIAIKGANCTICGCPHSLRVLHLNYDSLYREEENHFEDLIVLCDSCHKKLHEFMNENQAVIESFKQDLKSVKYDAQKYYREKFEEAFSKFLKDVLPAKYYKYSAFIPIVQTLWGLNNFYAEIYTPFSAHNIYCKFKKEYKDK